jgi:hypothetical protein
MPTPSTVAAGLGDLPVIVLVVAVLVLCATTLVTAFNLPDRRWSRHGWVLERRRHRRRASDRREAHDSAGVITSATVRLADRPAAIALPPAATATGGVDELDRLDDPEAVISHLLDTDPELLARVMSEWIRADDVPSTPPPSDP